MAAFHPLLTVTAAVLLCGAITGEVALAQVNMQMHLIYCHTSMLNTQVPRKLSATSKWPTRTAPTSPSPGTLWMATTAPATSITSASTTETDRTLVLVPTLAQYLTQTAI